MKNKIEKTLPKMSTLPGAVIAQRVRCGRLNCKCANGELHGLYCFRVWRMGSTRHKVYVRKKDVTSVQAACSAYRKERREYREILQESHNEWQRLKTMLKELGI